MGSPAATGALTVAVLAVSAFCAGRLLLATLYRRAAQRDADIVHVVMGVSMAGMLTGWLTGAWTDVWTVAFVGTTAWFARGVAVEVTGRAPGSPSGGHFPHLVASGSMVYMLLAARWTGMASMGAMPGIHAAPAAASSAASPVVTALVAAVLVADALLALGKGVRRAPVLAAAGATISTAPAPTSTATAPSGAFPASSTQGGGARRPLAPRATPICLMVMSLAMAYMLVAPRP